MVWDMRRIYSDASVRLSVSDTPHTPPSCIQVLTTNRKKSNSVYLYFWNHSLTFLLSKYIIYILLEYIKYRIGTIPFILPEYFLSIAATAGKNSWCAMVTISHFLKDLLVFPLKTGWIFPKKIRFDSSMISTNLVQCNEWPSNNNTCSFYKCLPAPTSRS